MTLNKIKYLVFICCICFLIGCDETSTEKDYKITFYITEQNIVVEDIIAKAGESINAPEEPEIDGYRFDGWYLDGEEFVFNVMPECNIILIPKFTAIYYVYIDTDGGTTVDPLVYAEGENILLPIDPVKNNYLFSHWEMDGAVFTGGLMPAESIQIIAIYDAAVTIYFNTGIAGELIDPIVGIAGDDVENPTMPEVEGYRFAGWTLNNEIYILKTIPYQSIFLTATWEVSEYTSLPALYVSIFDDNGSILDIDSVTRDDYEDIVVSMENTTDENLLSFTNALIRGRGNGSWSSSKRGYRIKFDSKESLLGEDSSKHWVLLSCKSDDFNDVSMLRNYLAYSTSKELFTNIDYTTSANFIDVFFNDEYYGVYLLVEQVRVESGRVDIDSEYGVEDTGYLVEYDSYASGTLGVDYFNVTGVKYGFTVKSPDPDEYLENGYTTEQYKSQISYIQSEMQKLYSAALSKNFSLFEQYADVDSFVDMYILHEYFKNTDAGWSSFYLYKESGGKIGLIAPWDFDASAGINRGDTGYSGIYVADSIVDYSSHTSSELFIALYATHEFKELVIKRWKELSDPIENYLEEIISDEKLEEIIYPMGKNYGKWEYAFSQSTCETKWLAEATTLRTWLYNRNNWLDNEWI